MQMERRKGGGQGVTDELHRLPGANEEWKFKTRKKVVCDIVDKKRCHDTRI